MTVFDFAEFPIIQTKRLQLRQMTYADAESLVELFSSPEVLRFISNPPTDTLEKARGLIDWFSDLYRNQEAIQWVITLDGQFIGTCGNYAWDKENRLIEIGYNILPRYWGQGYATEATHAIIQWSFANFGLHRIQADCTDGNIGSEKVMLKCGFKFEGIRRESAWEHGHFVDIKLFGLLAKEYDKGSNA